MRFLQIWCALSLLTASATMTALVGLETPPKSVPAKTKTKKRPTAPLPRCPASATPMPLEDKQRPRSRPAANTQPSRPGTREEQPKYRPYDAIRFAAADILSLPPDIDRRQVRYISLYNEKSSRLANRWRITSFVVNSLSKNSVIKLPPFVPGSNNTLIRFNLYDYLIDPKEFDRLCDLGSGSILLPEPYFQMPVIPIADSAAAAKEDRQTAQSSDLYHDESGTWKREYVQKEISPGVQQHDAYGRPIWKEKWTLIKPAAGNPKKPVISGQAKRQFVPEATWLVYPDKGASIRALTEAAHTVHPVVRGDWLATYALWAPRYYDLLGTGKTIKEFQKLLNVRAKADANFTMAGIVVKPPRRLGVTLNNRTIFFLTSNVDYGAYYWETNDSLKSSNDRQYLNIVLDLLKFRRGLATSPGLAATFFDATEDIGTLSNGLQAYFLTDGNGDRVDKAVADIARDNFSSYKDMQVWSARNCMTCHTRGLKAIDEAFRVRMPAGKLNGLIIADDDKKKTNSTLIQDFFGKPIAPIIAANQEYYERIIRTVTVGWTPEKLSKEYMEWTSDYIDEGITLKSMAWDAGVPVADLRQMLSKGIGLDPTLSDMLQDPPLDVRRDQFESNGFPQLMDFLQKHFLKEKH